MAKKEIKKPEFAPKKRTRKEDKSYSDNAFVRDLDKGVENLNKTTAEIDALVKQLSEKEGLTDKDKKFISDELEKLKYSSTRARNIIRRGK